MAPYARPVFARSLLDIFTSVVPFLALWALMFMVFDDSYWLVLLISIPAAGFLLRTFILFHDCTHGSFFASRRANVWGGRIFGLLVFQCFANWRHHHAVHHGSAGDLDRRGTGDVTDLDRRGVLLEALAVAARLPPVPPPGVMFGIGPIWSLLIGPRDLGRLEARQAAQQHPAHQRRRRRRWSGCACRRLRLAGRPADRGAADHHRRHRGRLALLRPAPVRGRLLGGQRRLGLLRGGAAGQQLPEAPPAAASSSPATSASTTSTT